MKFFFGNANPKNKTPTQKTKHQPKKQNANQNRNVFFENKWTKSLNNSFNKLAKK